MFSLFCEESTFGRHPSQDPVAQAAVQSGGVVGRGFIPPQKGTMETAQPHSRTGLGGVGGYSHYFLAT